MERPKSDVLFYDADCPLCLRFKQALERLPGTDKISFISIRDEQTFEQYPQLDRQACMSEIHLLLQDGKLIKGVEVVTYLLEQFPGVKHFAWLIESNMGQKAISFFHQTVDQYRRTLIDYCGGCSKNS